VQQPDGGGSRLARQVVSSQWLEYCQLITYIAPWFSLVSLLRASGPSAIVFTYRDSVVYLSTLNHEDCTRKFSEVLATQASSGNGTTKREHHSNGFPVLFAVFWTVIK
jgi:hypothetical protein